MNTAANKIVITRAQLVAIVQEAEADRLPLNVALTAKFDLKNRFNLFPTATPRKGERRPEGFYLACLRGRIGGIYSSEVRDRQELDGMERDFAALKHWSDSGRAGSVTIKDGKPHSVAMILDGYDRVNGDTLFTEAGEPIDPTFLAQYAKPRRDEGSQKAHQGLTDCDAVQFRNVLLTSIVEVSIMDPTDAGVALATYTVVQ